MAQATRFCRVLLAEGGSLRFRDYEAASLLAWKQQISQAAAPILDRQLSLITWINRQSNEKLVLLHADSIKQWSTELLFPLRTEKIVARVSIRPRGTQIPALKCDIGLFRGRVVSIDFDQPPRAIFPQSKKLRVADLKQTRLPDLEDVEVTGSRIFTDPMEQEPPSARREVVPGAWSGLIKEWAEQWELKDVREPLPESEREKLVTEMDAGLPPDYLSLVSQTEGLRIGSWTIFGLSGIRKVTRPDGNFYILAQFDGSHDLAVAQCSKDGALYSLPYDGDLAEPAGNVFGAVIERELDKAA